MKLFGKPFLYFLSGLVLGTCLVNILSLTFHKLSCFRAYVGRNKTRDTHLQIKEKFLLIGLMASRTNLRNRSAVIFDTWARQIPGMIIQFTEKSEKHSGNLPVVVLRDISEKTSTRHKYFSMLKYMHDNYEDVFEWFMTADADTFVRYKHLDLFLRSMNSTKPHVIRHEVNEDNKSKQDSFADCIQSSGSIYSKETVRRIFSNDLVTSCNTSETCDTHKQEIVCTSTEEFTKLFYQKYNGDKFSVNEKFDKRLSNALTVYPVKQDNFFYNLQTYFHITNIIQLRKKLSQLDDVILKTNSRLLQMTMDENKQIFCEEFVNKVKPLGEEIIWHFVRSSLVYSHRNLFEKPFEKIQNRRKIGKSASMRSLRNLGLKSDVVVHFYENLKIGSGLQHIFVTGHKNVSFRTYLTTRTFQPFEITESTTSFTYKDTTIFLILPLHGRSNTLHRFLKSLNVAVFHYGGSVVLRVVLYRDGINEYLTSIKYINNMKTKHRALKIEILMEAGAFARAKAIKKGLEGLSLNSLTLITDVDMHFTSDFLQRVFLNTECGKRAYFPVTFTEYDPSLLCSVKQECAPNTTTFNFDQERGTWRYFGFGIVGVYKSDVLKVGDFNALIQGWGKEDADFCEKCVKSGLSVFRTTDPALVHRYHSKICDISLPRDQFRMCIRSRDVLYGSQSVLSNIVFNKTNIK